MSPLVKKSKARKKSKNIKGSPQVLAAAQCKPWGDAGNTKCYCVNYREREITQFWSATDFIKSQDWLLLFFFGGKDQTRDLTHYTGVPPNHTPQPCGTASDTPDSSATGSNGNALGELGIVVCTCNPSILKAEALLGYGEILSQKNHKTKWNFALHSCPAVCKAVYYIHSRKKSHQTCGLCRQKSFSTYVK